MNKTSRFLLIFVIAWLATGAMVARTPATSVEASPGDWRFTCARVLATERDIWFDAPGAGVNDEGGLFYFTNNSTDNETCTALRDISPAVSSTQYPKLRIRAAVSDGARFNVQVFEFGVSEFCETRVATIAWTDDQDHSGFVTKERTLPPDKNICAIKVILDDYPNNIATGRTMALIGDIRIWNGTNFAWHETFTAEP
jgi:hypothetical protein